MKAKAYFNLELEQRLYNQIYEALQGNVLEEIFNRANVSSSECELKSLFEGHSFKVNRRILEKYFRILKEVQSVLSFNDPIDFYITGNSSVNAFVIEAVHKGNPHILNVNSQLIQLMSDDELKFVIGHELGHLINKNSRLNLLIHRIFPHNRLPLLLSRKIRLWEQLSELVADRYGFYVMPDLKVCLSAFFKMSSGLDMNKMNMDVEAYIEENNKQLAYFKHDEGINLDEHPVNPIRVQAIYLFSQSKLFKTNKALSDEQLDTSMQELIKVLMQVRKSDEDSSIANFIATARLLMASVDDEVTQKEIENIISSLSEFYVFPKEFLDNITHRENAVKIFNDAVGNIMNKYTHQRQELLLYLIHIAVIDKKIKKQEVDFVFSFGAKIGFSDIEIAQMFVGVVQQQFIPSIEAIS